MRLKVRYLLAGALAGAILICPAMAASSFPDVDEYAPYAEAVEYLKSGTSWSGTTMVILTQIKPLLVLKWQQ